MSTDSNPLMQIAPAKRVGLTLDEARARLTAERVAAAARVAALELAELSDAPGDAIDLEPSPSCRAAFERALHAAAMAGCGRLKPEHLLRALLADPGSGAARTLARLGVDGDAVADGLAVAA